MGEGGCSGKASSGTRSPRRERCSQGGLGGLLSGKLLPGRAVARAVALGRPGLKVLLLSLAL